MSSKKDKKPIFTSNKVLAIGMVATLVLVATPIIIYVCNFRGNVISDVPSEWGTFGDYIGGTLNPIIAMLTLVVTIIIAVHLHKIETRYHHDTVKPYFTIKTGEFYSPIVTNNPPSIEAELFNYSSSTKAPNAQQPNYLPLKISNKGLGIATQVVAEFEISLSEIKKLLPLDTPNIRLSPSEIKTDEDARQFMSINIDSNYYNHHGGMKILAIEKYGVGTIEQNKKEKLPIPSQFIRVFKLYNIKRKLGQPIDEFPTIFLTLTYKNIYDVTLSSKFRIGLVHMLDYIDASRYKLFAEPI